MCYQGSAIFSRKLFDVSSYNTGNYSHIPIFSFAHMISNIFKIEGKTLKKNQKKKFKLLFYSSMKQKLIMNYTPNRMASIIETASLMACARK